MFHWCTMMIVILCNLFNKMIKKTKSIKLSTLFAMGKIKYQSTYFNPKKKQWIRMKLPHETFFLLIETFSFLSSPKNPPTHVRLSLKSSDYVEQNRDPPRWYEKKKHDHTFFTSHFIGKLSCFPNIPDKSYMTLSSITQTIIPLTGKPKAEERKLHVYWRRNSKRICLVEKHRLSMRCEPNFQRS